MSLNLEKQLTFVSSLARVPSHLSPGTGRPSRPHGYTLHVPVCTQQLTAAPRFQYGAYHHNQVNVIIHMVCVPLILFSFFAVVCVPPLL